MRVPDRTGVITGYRVWRVLPSGWIAPSESLHAQTGHWAWSLSGPTAARCPVRVRIASSEPPYANQPCEDPPGWGCRCGLYARYEPDGELQRLPYVAGSVLAWGRVVHHEEHSFFRAEKALPVAFVRPRGGDGLFPEEAEQKLLRVAEALGAELVNGPDELREFTEVEACKW